MRSEEDPAPVRCGPGMIAEAFARVDARQRIAEPDDGKATITSE